MPALARAALFLRTAVLHAAQGGALPVPNLAAYPHACGSGLAAVERNSTPVMQSR